MLRKGDAIEADAALKRRRRASIEAAQKALAARPPAPPYRGRSSSRLAGLRHVKKVTRFEDAVRRAIKAQSLRAAAASAAAPHDAYASWGHPLRGLVLHRPSACGRRWELPDDESEQGDGDGDGNQDDVDGDGNQDDVDGDGIGDGNEDGDEDVQGEVKDDRSAEALQPMPPPPRPSPSPGSARTFLHRMLPPSAHAFSLSARAVGEGSSPVGRVASAAVGSTREGASSRQHACPSRPVTSPTIGHGTSMGMGMGIHRGASSSRSSSHGWPHPTHGRPHTTHGSRRPSQGPSQGLSALEYNESWVREWGRRSDVRWPLKPPPRVPSKAEVCMHYHKQRAAWTPRPLSPTGAPLPRGSPSPRPSPRPSSSSPMSFSPLPGSMAGSMLPSPRRLASRDGSRSSQLQRGHAVHAFIDSDSMRIDLDVLNPPKSKQPSFTGQILATR